MRSFLTFPSTWNGQQLRSKKEQLLLKRETLCSSSKEGKDWSSSSLLVSAHLLPGTVTPYLLGQRHGPSAGCACLLVPPGGQSPCCGMRLCLERNESPGEAKTATWKQHPHESQIQCHPLLSPSMYTQYKFYPTQNPTSAPRLQHSPLDPQCKWVPGCVSVPMSEILD